MNSLHLWIVNYLINKHTGKVRRNNTTTRTCFMLVLYPWMCSWEREWFLSLEHGVPCAEELSCPINGSLFWGFFGYNHSLIVNRSVQLSTTLISTFNNYEWFTHAFTQWEDGDLGNSIIILQILLLFNCTFPRVHKSKVSALIRMVAQAPKLLKQDDYYVLSYCLFYGVTDTFHGNIYISGAKEISFPKKNNYSASPSSFTVMYALFCFSIIGKPA
jgi:hypothetical protein